MDRFARLSALDASFLALETPTTPFVVGARLVFEGGSLRRKDGDLDTATLERFVASAVGDLRRYRQRLARVPLFGNPVWVDDWDFDLSRHLFFDRVDPPGSDRQLDELVGDILSRDLDMGSPPWELHVVDRLEGGRFAIIAKVHHCMVDGVAGVRLLESLLHESPREYAPESPPWFQRRTPGRTALLLAELSHRARGLWEMSKKSRSGSRRARPSPGDVAKLLRQGLSPSTRVGINPRRIDRGRKFVGYDMPLDELGKAKEELKVSLNDAVLAVVAGGFRSFLARRGVAVSRVHRFRAMVPVNVRRSGDPGLGSRVALLIVPLPVDEPDPIERCRRVRAFTRRRKERTKDVASGDFLLRLADVTSPALLSVALRTALRFRAFNVVVTNVPGPRRPLHLLDARLESFHPVVNLWHGEAVGLALMSYRDRLYLGVHAARETFGSVDELVGDLRASYSDLIAALPSQAPAEPARGAGS